MKTSRYGPLDMRPTPPLAIPKPRATMAAELETMSQRMEALEALLKHVLGGHVLIRGQWVDASAQSLKQEGLCRRCDYQDMWPGCPKLCLK